MGKLSKKQLKEMINADLTNQLISKGKLGKFYDDLKDDYLYFWDLKLKLQKDIKDNGLRYKTTNGNGIETEKPNESVKNLLSVNAQMLKILNDLDLREPTVSIPPIEKVVDAKDLLQRD